MDGLEENLKALRDSDSKGAAAFLKSHEENFEELETCLKNLRAIAS